jgi:hypothetical protein
MTYHSREALENLGETIRDKAIQVIVTLFNEYTRSRTTGGAVGDPVLFAGKNPNLPASFTTHAPTEGELRAYLWGCYSDIPGLFVSSSGSNPENCKQSIDSLWESAFILHPSLTPTTSNGKLSYPIPESFSWDETPLETRINNIGHLCDSWDGEASDAFASYVGQFSTAIDLQHDLAVALAVTLDAHREILSRSYFDIWNIGQETLKALDTIGDCDPQATSVTLTVVGALAAVLAEFATGGLATGLVIGAEAAGVGSALFGVMQGPSTPIGGGTVPVVISQMRAAVSKLTGDIDGQRQQLLRVLRASASKVDEAMVNNTIQIKAPKPLNALKKAYIHHIRQEFYR